MGIVCRRDANANRFETCSGGLPARFDDVIDTHCLAADGRRVAFAAPDGSVYASGDSGRSWEQIGRGLSDVRCLIFA
jgi:hypothetical protein